MLLSWIHVIGFKEFGKENQRSLNTLDSCLVKMCFSPPYCHYFSAFWDKKTKGQTSSNILDDQLEHPHHTAFDIILDNFVIRIPY